MTYEPPKDLVIRVPGNLRGRVADGMRHEAREMREQYPKRRAKTQMGVHAHQIAAALCSLANKIDY